MTGCFEIDIDHYSKHSLSYRLSPVVDDPSPWPSEWWNVRRDLKFLPDGTFDAEAHQVLPKQWVIINPILDEYPETIGFAYGDSKPPLIVSTRLKEAIQDKFPSVCDFVTVGKIWDTRLKREILDPPYYFMALCQTVDTWDKTKSDITTTTGANGTKIHWVNSQRMANRKTIQNQILWKDALTHTHLCSVTFKQLAERLGCCGLSFTVVPVSDT